jgi:hypothetical protein
MSFLTPLAFALAALAPVIIAMYLLKLRRTEKQVSSTYLWRKMVRDVEANAPWQRLRRNLLLLLQLLILAALIFALARPATPVQGLSSKAVILVLDTSASMSAEDVQPTRFEAAKEQARQIIDGLQNDAAITIIAAGEQPILKLQNSLDRRQALLTVSELRAAATGSDLGAALQLASAAAARQPDAQIVLLSDGGGLFPERLSIQGALRYLPLGLRNENQAIALLNAQRAPGGQSATAFAQVINYGDSPAERRLAFYADGQLAKVTDLSLEPGAEQAVLAEALPPDTRLVEARLLREGLAQEPAPGQTVDDLPIDDIALAPLRLPLAGQVNLISQGNLFLETALSLQPGLQLTTTLPGQSGAYPEAALTIFDANLPLTASLPAGNLLFIAPPSSSELFTVTGLINAPLPILAAPEHPLVQNITFDTISILDANALQPRLVNGRPWAQLLLDGEWQAANQARYHSPLLFAGQVQGRCVAVLAFDLLHSDMPLQPAFPILISNLVNWLAPGECEGLPSQATPGQVLSFTAGPEVKTVALTRPDGSRLEIQPGSTGEVIIDELFQPGLYNLQAGNSIQFAVNLASPRESSLTPLDNLPVQGLEPAQAAAASQQSLREWWRLLAGLALIILIIEWLVYRRASLALLLNRISNQQPARNSTITRKS